MESSRGAARGCGEALEGMLPQQLLCRVVCHDGREGAEEENGEGGEGGRRERRARNNISQNVQMGSSNDETLPISGRDSMRCRSTRTSSPRRAGHVGKIRQADKADIPAPRSLTPPPRVETRREHLTSHIPSRVTHRILIERLALDCRLSDSGLEPSTLCHRQDWIFHQSANCSSQPPTTPSLAHLELPSKAKRRTTRHGE